MKHIKEFDGLRGLLASWVMLAHVFYLSYFARLTSATRADIPVDIFIILSGFVIFNLLDRGETYGAFVTRRFFRLFPAFFLSLVFCVLLSEFLQVWTPESSQHTFSVENNQTLVPHLLAHLTMLHGAVPDQMLLRSSLSYLPPAWSISLEWQFYLLAPFLFAFLKRPNFRLALLLLLLVVVRVLCIAHRFGPPFLPNLTFGYFDAFLPLKIELFLIGGLSCFIWKWLSAREYKLELHAGWPAVTLLLVAIVLTRSVVATALWSCLFLLLVGFRFGQPTPLARGTAFFLNLRPLQWLGMVSYSLYIVHWPVLVLVRFGIQQTFPQLGPIPQAALLGMLGFAMTFGLAGIMYSWIEKPCMDYARELTRRWRSENFVSAGVAKSS